MKFITTYAFVIFAFSYFGDQYFQGNYRMSDPEGYYSDYFVFIADDNKNSPLVVPIDINWTLYKESYDIEYKSWYGTNQDWPIEYVTKSISSKRSAIPSESFDHPNTKSFSFDGRKRTIATNIKGDHEIEIKIPNEEEWVRASLESDFPIYAFRTDIKVDGDSRSGWMLYERIRFEEMKKFDGFEAFYWMPIVVKGDLYHFVQHRGEQTAAKWSSIDGSLSVETVLSFDFEIIQMVSDVKSKRMEIPKNIHIKVPEWQLDIMLTSKGEQIGYGEEYPKGLSFFRQSLLQSERESKDIGIGMMELILADN